MQLIFDQDDEDGRFAKQEFKDQIHAGRMVFTNMHRYDTKDLQHGMEKQIYLIMGSILLGVATLGIDAVSMKGVDLKELDTEFGLREKGFIAVAVVSLGYYKPTDFNATLPKSRLPEAEIITQLVQI